MKNKENKRSVIIVNTQPMFESVVRCMTMTIDIVSFAGTVGGGLFVIAGFQLFCLIHLYIIASHVRGYQLEISNCWKLFAPYSIIVNKGDTVIVHGIVLYLRTGNRKPMDLNQDTSVNRELI